MGGNLSQPPQALLFQQGHMEAVIGKPVPRKAEGIIHAVGILLLFGLMIVVLFKDIFALF